MTADAKTTQINFGFNLKYLSYVIFAVLIITGFQHWVFDWYTNFLALMTCIGCAVVITSIYFIRKDPVAFAKRKNLTVEQINGPVGDELFRAPALNSALQFMILPVMAALAGFETQAVIIALCGLSVFAFKSTYKVLH